VNILNQKLRSYLQSVKSNHFIPVNPHSRWFNERELKARPIFYIERLLFTFNIGPSQAEQLLRVTSGIAAELIKAHDANESVSLNVIRSKLSKKYGYGGVPRLVDIISAIPDDYKKALLPKLKARPIRTASGVSILVLLNHRLKLHRLPLLR